MILLPDRLVKAATPSDAARSRPGASVGGMGLPRGVTARLLAMAGLVLAMLLTAVVLQWRQSSLLSQAALTHGDNTAFMVYQAEVEFLRLRAAWPHPGEVSTDPEALRLRYEIFVSRIRLMRDSRNLAALIEPAERDALIATSEAFIAQADPLLAADPPQALSASAWLGLGQSLAAAGPDLRQLSTRGADLMNRTHAARTQAVQQHNRLALLSTALLGGLVALLGVLVARQLWLAHRREGQLKALAADLEQAHAEAERASQAKSDFLANMSHEIRTPFQGLMGMLTLIGSGPLSDRQREQLATARTSADHLLALLNDTLDLSSLDAGCVRIEPQATALPPLLRAVEALMAPQALRKGLRWSVEQADDVPPIILVDAMRLRQVLFNLLSNAVKFTDSGSVALRVALVTDGAEDRPQLGFAVIDSGIGMDGPTQQRLFSRFGQGDASRSRRFGGTGLGLEISRRLARLMGGDINVSSEPGRGSCFRLLLPLDTVPVNLTGARPLTVGDLPATGGPDVPPSSAGRMPVALPLRVLVAEDNPVNVLVLQALLDQLGHQAVFVQDGHAVVDKAAEQRFDAVLMDLHMPGQDGYEAAAAIRALPDGLAAGVPIVALTADGFAETRQRCLASGMQDFLTKPVSAEALRDALQRLPGGAATAPTPEPA